MFVHICVRFQLFVAHVLLFEGGIGAETSFIGGASGQMQF